jgi:hypothetical protein
MELGSHTLLRVVVGQVGIVPFDAERLGPRTYSRSVFALLSRASRSLICSMVNITASASGMLSFVSDGTCCSRERVGWKQTLTPQPVPRTFLVPLRSRFKIATPRR